MFLNSLNWNLEVFLLLISDIFVFISFIFAFNNFRKTKNTFFLTLMITFSATCFSIFFRVLSLLLGSPILFKIHILTVIPAAFFGILILDKINRYSLDPLKMLFLGICSTGIIFSLFDPLSVIEIELLSGDKSFHPSKATTVWVLILIALTIFYFIYNSILIYTRDPPNVKKSLIILSIGGCIFGVVTFLFLISEIPNVFPGLEMMPLAIGALIPSITFLKSPKIIEVILKSGEISRIKYFEKILPICSNCKKIRDNEGNWHQIEDYLLCHSEIRFSHGYCPECGKKFLSEIEED